MQLEPLVHHVIRLSAALQHRRAEEDTRRSPCDEDGLVVTCMADVKETRLKEAEDLRTYLEGLPTPALYTLVAVMYAGRGDYGHRPNWPCCVQAVQRTFARPERAVNQLVGKVHLAQLLRQGLARLRRAGCEVPDAR